MYGDAQFVADTFLIERTLQALYLSDEGLQKHAFDLGSTLSGIGSSIQSFIGSQVAGKDEGGVARTVTNFLAPAVFFRLHPILGIIATAGQLFGFDLYSIYQNIVGAIKPSIEKGIPVSADQVNDAAKSAMPGMATEASVDFLSPLRDLESSGYFKKEAQKASPDILGNINSSSPIIRMFSFLSPSRRGNILVGIIVWFLKTVLMSAGMLAVGGMAASVMGKPPKDMSPTSQQAGPSSLSPRSTGAGSQVFKNKPGDLWIENLNGEQPWERILQWTFASYPDLYQYKDIVLRTPSFWNAVSSVQHNWRPGQQQLSVPDPYKKRDDITNLFINDVYSNVNQNIGTQ